jgi:uncharacterized integral membrane protein
LLSKSTQVNPTPASLSLTAKASRPVVQIEAVYIDTDFHGPGVYSADRTLIQIGTPRALDPSASASRWSVLVQNATINAHTMSAPSAQKPPEGSQRKLGRGGARGRSEASDRSEIARASALFILTALAIVFAVLNLDDVEVHWAFGSGRAPLIVVIVISLLVGSVLTYFGERVSRRRRR